MPVCMFSLLLVLRFHGLFTSTSRPRAAAICLSRSLPTTRSAVSSASKTKPPLAVLPVGVRYPDQPPDVPLRSSDSASLADLLNWRAEVLASQHEVRSAQIAHEAALACERLAALRVTEATSRRETAWRAYTLLMGFSSFDNKSPVDSDAPVGPAPVKVKGKEKGKGKGKARALSSSEDDGEDGEEELVSRELEGSEGGAGGPSNPMDLT